MLTFERIIEWSIRNNLEVRLRSYKVSAHAEDTMKLWKVRFSTPSNGVGQLKCVELEGWDKDDLMKRIEHGAERIVQELKYTAI